MPAAWQDASNDVPQDITFFFLLLIIIILFVNFISLSHTVMLQNT